MPLPLLPIAGMMLSAQMGVGALLFGRKRSNDEAIAQEQAARHSLVQQQELLRTAQNRLRKQLKKLAALRSEAVTTILQSFIELRSSLRNLDSNEPMLKLACGGATLRAPTSEELSGMRGAMTLPTETIALDTVPDEESAVRRLRSNLNSLSESVHTQVEILATLLPRLASTLSKLSFNVKMNSDYRRLSQVNLPGDVLSPRDLVPLTHHYAAVITALVSVPLVSAKGESVALTPTLKYATATALRFNGWR